MRAQLLDHVRVLRTCGWRNRRELKIWLCLDLSFLARHQSHSSCWGLSFLLFVVQILFRAGVLLMLKIKQSLFCHVIVGLFNIYPFLISLRFSSHHTGILVFLPIFSNLKTRLLIVMENNPLWIIAWLLTVLLIWYLQTFLRFDSHLILIDLI